MPSEAGKTTLRDARPGDYAVYTELFRELRVDEAPLPYERFCTEMLPTTVIAEDAEGTLGFAFFRPAKDLVHLSNLVTAPAARGRGVARLLIGEVAQRSRLLGCSEMTLNVKPDNAAAIRLYERVGLSRVRLNRHLRMAWTVFDALADSAAPFASAVRPIEPTDDETLEREHDLARGLFATQRTQADRVLRMLDHDSGPSSVAVFDRHFGGMYPYRAKDVAHALSLLRSVRPFAPEGAAAITLRIEGQPDLADGLVAVGAEPRFDTLFMRGALATIA